MSRRKLFRGMKLVNRDRWRPSTARMPSVDRIVRWWTLRLHAARDLTRSFDLDAADRGSSAVWRLLDDWIEPGTGPAKSLLDQAWRKYGEAPIFPLHREVPRLAELAARIGLSEAEANVMTVLLVLAACDDIRDLVDDLGRDRVGPRAGAMLALLAALPVPTVNAALRRGGTLHRLGLVEGSPQGDSLANIVPGDSRFTALVVEPEAPLDPLLAEFFRPAPLAGLQAADFEHAQTDLSILRALLSSGDAPPPGTNILIHGPPGSGKSELARLLARLTGRAAHEVSTADTDGDAHAQRGLWTGYSLAQLLLSRAANALLIVDEADPMLESGYGPHCHLSAPPRADSGKGWLNRMLETAGTPTIWIANQIRGIDPSHLRRMDYVLPLGKMPERVRRRLADATAREQGLSADWARETARNEDLMPAHLGKVSRVVARLPADVPAEERNRVAQRTLTHLHRAIGIHQPARLEEPPLGRWDPDWIVTRPGLDRIEQTVRRGAVRACFHGPPGTGKTELAHELSRRLDRPLHVRRASNLLSMWVGGTERAIAEAFERAAGEEAILLIDEIDGFLADRAGAGRNWEVTQVNELLTQMEAFRGALIATTNRLDALDPASLRRFDLKVRFELPGVRELEALGNALCAKSGIVAPPAGAFSSLCGLCAGDFAAVARQVSTHDRLTLDEMLSALLDEQRLKPGNAGRIGFLR